VTSSKTGASGYLTKEDAPDHLVSTIRRMFYGGNSFRVWDMISVKANLSNASYS
jgi:DNA-binding NarL/FixJ family response regulator